MYESDIYQKITVKVDKKVIKQLKKGKKVKLSGYGICSHELIETKVKPLNDGGFLIKPKMDGLDVEQPLFEVDTIEEALEIIEEIYSGKHYA